MKEQMLEKDTCKEHMQRTHAKNACKEHMPRTHAENTCKERMQTEERAWNDHRRAFCLFFVVPHKNRDVGIVVSLKFQ